MTSISAGHIILTPTQPVGSGRPQRGSNPGPPDQESRALPTELPRPPTGVRGNDDDDRPLGTIAIKCDSKLCFLFFSHQMVTFIDITCLYTCNYVSLETDRQIHDC